MKAAANTQPTARQVKVMHAQYQHAIKKPSTHAYIMDEVDPFTWYVLLRGIAGHEDAFVGGEYLMRMKLPLDFPANPLSFFTLTPNGLYDISDKPTCVSIGEYHKDQHRAALGADGFVDNLVSGMICWQDMGGGINILKTTADTKKKLARESIAYNNTHYAELVEKIKAAYDAYSAKWTTPDAPAIIALAKGQK